MPQPINVEGVGVINFEDGMTPDQIKTAIVNDILPQYQQAQQTAPEESGFLRS